MPKVLAQIREQVPSVLTLVTGAVESNVIDQRIAGHHVRRDFTSPTGVALPPDDDVCILRLCIVLLGSADHGSIA